ncbi:MAG: LEA type 2 family protein [Janthinobacterium lividum]
MQRVLRFTAATVLALGLAGCALTSSTPPSVDVMAVQLIGMGLVRQQLAVTLCVTNPNADALAFRAVTANFDLSGQPLAAGQSDLSIRLPPRASVVVPFTVVTTVQNASSQLLGVIRTGRIEYRVHGTVTLQGTFGLTLPYSRSGQIDPLASGLSLIAAASDPVSSQCQTASPLPARLDAG